MATPHAPHLIGILALVVLQVAIFARKSQNTVVRLKRTKAVWGGGASEESVMNGTRQVVVDGTPVKLSL